MKTFQSLWKFSNPSGGRAHERVRALRLVREQRGVRLDVAREVAQAARHLARERDVRRIDQVGKEARAPLAQKAFVLTGRYDSAIASYLGEAVDADEGVEDGATLTVIVDTEVILLRSTSGQE